MEHLELFLLLAWCSCYFLSSTASAHGAAPLPPPHMVLLLLSSWMCVLCCYLLPQRVVLLLLFSQMCVVLLLLLLLPPDVCGTAPSPPPGCIGCCSSSSSMCGSSSLARRAAAPPDVWQTGGENEDDAPNRMLSLHFWPRGGMEQMGSHMEQLFKMFFRWAVGFFTYFEYGNVSCVHRLTAHIPCTWTNKIHKKI
jgi:hypothetical protein